MNKQVIEPSLCVMDEKIDQLTIPPEKDADGIPKHQGIPKSIFIEDVAAFLKKEEMEADGVLILYQKLYQKYKIMQESIRKRRAQLRDQLPDFLSSVKMIEHLMLKRNEDRSDRSSGDYEKKPLKTRFTLSSNVFVDGEIEDYENLGIWLGCNIMVEHTLDEAHAMIKVNIEKIEKGLGEVTKTEDYIREQINTTEVNMARFYNYVVIQKRESGTTTLPKSVMSK
ncbi:hypothetical protein SNEBB_009324 [Seison nebaliae]|nr:hypothetical protein SNEBB_009324 [Seison nebaliae]